MKNITITNLESNQRIDKYVRKYLNEAPLSFIYRLFRKKDIKVNGHWVKENYIIQENDVVSIYVTDSQLEEFNKPKEALKKDLNYPIVGLIEKFQNGFGFLISISKFHDIRIQRMILARLFAHSVLHRDYIIENRKIEIRDFWKTDEMSREANDFASKLLIPKATFLEIIKNGSTIGKEADRFVVPPRFMKYRAFNLGLVKEF